jgi:hypothetical protein
VPKVTQLVGGRGMGLEPRQFDARSYILGLLSLLYGDLCASPAGYPHVQTHGCAPSNLSSASGLGYCRPTIVVTAKPGPGPVPVQTVKRGDHDQCCDTQFLGPGEAF